MSSSPGPSSQKPLHAAEKRGARDGRAEELRRQILELVAEYNEEAFRPEPFLPGSTAVRYAGRVWDEDEMVQLVDAALDFWLTAGRFAEQLEHDLADQFGLRHASLVNSGSSANLVALSALTSKKLAHRRLVPGDEVITAACGFPTTVNPIVQNGLVPVFVDAEVPTYNPSPDQIEAAVGDRTRAIMLAHTLGNPFEVDAVAEIAARHGLWLIEDCCDALGSTYKGRKVGTFGDLATLSFYPAHQITTGEGGCVVCDSGQLKSIVESFRDWGRDCWCEPGDDNACGRRFNWQFGELPPGYDHKYVFSHVGYNLKLTDLQAAVGVAQLRKLGDFHAARRRNFAALLEGVRDLEDVLILPEATPGSDPNWFGFPLAVRPESGVSRDAVTDHLDERRIATRLLFGGNLARQPAYLEIPHRRVGELAGADFVMDNVFWVGVYPGLTEEALAFMIDELHAAVGRPRSG